MKRNIARFVPAKKKAEAIAKKVDGVKRVKNELKVEAKKGS